ncbi:MAG: hypothetical protein EON58_11310 [Alphaproteobacteria bacterium]|nr:MAG: hypothetical protein EON58_11310 [Alphaproteobacteria bacterium]
MTDVALTLKEALNEADNAAGVIILTLKKDNRVSLLTSTMNPLQKAYLSAYLTAYMTNKFQRNEE